MGGKRNAVVLVVIALAACGGRERTPPTPSPSATARGARMPLTVPPSGVSLDACPLLTRQEVGAALGTAVGDGVPQKMGQAASCRWAAPSGLESANLSVTVYDGAPQARAAFEAAVKINRYRSVPGLGEGAYTSPMYDLTVLTGRYELAVDVNVMQDEQTSVARRLAEPAVARLPR